MIIEILRAVAEFSRLEYVKDVERSKKHLARKGYSTGGPPPFGLRRVELQDNGCKRVKWEPDPETAPIAKKIFAMYADGMGFKKITAFLNEKGITTIRGLPWRSSSFSRMLRNEIYIGNVVYNKEEKRNGCYHGSFETKDPDDGGNGGVEGEDSGGKNSRRKRGRPKNRGPREDISVHKFLGEKHGEGGI